MKIWLHSTSFSASSIDSGAPLISSSLEEDCGCDGNDRWDDNDPPIPDMLTFIAQDTRPMHRHTFIYAEALHIQQLSENRWLVCAPTGEGRLAVLDIEAYSLLELFRVPQVLQEVITSENMLQIAQAVDLFIRAGFLVDQDLDNISGQNLPSRKQENEIQTLSVWLHITNSCNLHCDYCYISKTSEHMYDDTAKRSIDAIIRSALAFHYRAIRVTFAGGEATLRMPELIATYDYAFQQAQDNGLDFSAHVISNGAALPLRAIEQMKQRQIGLMISLDGVGTAHDQQRPLVNGQGSFTFIDRTITRLLKAGLVPYINVTVSQRNLDELPSLLAYLFQRDLPFGLSYYRDNDCSTYLSDLQFGDTQMIKGMKDAFAYIEEHLPKRRLLSGLVDKARTNSPRHYSCGMGRHYMVVDQQGGVAKCQMEIRNTVTTINVENPLQVIRADRKGVQAVAVDDKEGCRDCEWRYWCSGGCAMLTYRLTGRNDIKSPNCAIYKALFPEALRLEALRLLKYYQPVQFA